MNERQDTRKQISRAQTGRRPVRKASRNGRDSQRRRKRQLYRRKQILIRTASVFLMAALAAGIFFLVKSIFFPDPGYYRPEGWNAEQTAEASDAFDRSGNGEENGTEMQGTDGLSEEADTEKGMEG